MKYSVGDIVKIKTWEEMKKECPLNKRGDILTKHFTFDKDRERILQNQNTDRTITVTEILPYSYRVKETQALVWTDDMIECLAEKYVEPIPIETRFEILDL